MRIAITDLRVDDSIQARVALSLDTVSEYADALRRGDEFPPVTAFKDADGALWLADGFHRYHAHKESGAVDIEAEVQGGSHRDARLFAIRSNQRHGLPRSRADKSKALDALLLDPEWQMWSDSRIAKEVGVDPHTVKSHRANKGIPKSTQVVCEKDGARYTMDTWAIGKARGVETVSKASLLDAARFAARAVPTQKEVKKAHQAWLFWEAEGTTKPPSSPNIQPPWVSPPEPPPPPPPTPATDWAADVFGVPRIRPGTSFRLGLTEAHWEKLREKFPDLKPEELTVEPPRDKT